MEKKKNEWQSAFGICENSGRPSRYLQSLAEANIIGLLSDEEAEIELLKHYGNHASNIKYQKDLIILRIKRYLAVKDFNLSKEYLFAIHKYLFNGVYEDAGVIRLTNLSRKEKCLEGYSVIYANQPMIDADLEYDFALQRKKRPKSKDPYDMIDYLAPFISNIWQAHPFSNGNTRTVSVFLEKYLISMGYNTTNDIFKENSTYFRNSLVRANYTTIPHLAPTDIYLRKFLEKVLVNPDINLDINETYINPPQRLR